MYLQYFTFQQSATRLTEAINMVKALLKSNKELREMIDKTNKKCETLENEVFQVILTHMYSSLNLY